MILKLILTLVLGFNLCSLSSAEEVIDNKKKEVVSLNATEPHKVDEKFKEIHKQSEQDTKSQSEDIKAKQGEALPAKPEDHTPLSMKVTYKSDNLDELQLYNQKDRLAAEIKYKNNRPAIIKLFDSNGNLRSGDYKDFYPSGKLKTMKTYRQGIQLVEVGYYETGQLQYKMKKKQNGQIAMFRAYEADGQLKEGSHKEFYSDGRVKGIGSFSRGLPDGDFVSFCQDGRVVAEKQFKKGRLLSKNWKEGNTTYSSICEDVFAQLDNDITPIITVMPPTTCSGTIAQSARL